MVAGVQRQSGCSYGRVGFAIDFTGGRYVLSREKFIPYERGPPVYICVFVSYSCEIIGNNQ